jgi:leucyl/phenylalanyl-tRNA--protein transferase
MIYLPLLDGNLPDCFPNPCEALIEPNGLLAMGGDLSPQRLLSAYSQGIFPWFSEGEPMLWWSPDPRCVFRTQTLNIHRGLRRQLAGRQWRLTVDHAFEQVIRACAAPRAIESGTWIMPAMIEGYSRLHALGHAHSVEVWEGHRLVGGIYGVAVGRLFCGESMFSAESGGSKLALIVLADLLRSLDFPLIDTQVSNPHTLLLGAIEVPRLEYLQDVALLSQLPGYVGNWTDYTPRLLQPCLA